MHGRSRRPGRSLRTLRPLWSPYFSSGLLGTIWENDSVAGALKLQSANYVQGSSRRSCSDADTHGISTRPPQHQSVTLRDRSICANRRRIYEVPRCRPGFIAQSNIAAARCVIVASLESEEGVVVAGGVAVASLEAGECVVVASGVGDASLEAGEGVVVASGVAEASIEAGECVVVAGGVVVASIEAGKGVVVASGVVDASIEAGEGVSLPVVL